MFGRDGLNQGTRLALLEGVVFIHYLLKPGYQKHAVQSQIVYIRDRILQTLKSSEYSIKDPSKVSE